MNAPKLTFHCSPAVHIPFLSLDGMEHKRIFDRMLSAENQPESPEKKPRCMPRRLPWQPPPASILCRVEKSGLVLAFDLTFVEESSFSEKLRRLQLSWAMSDTSDAKVRILGGSHEQSAKVLTEFFLDVAEVVARDRGTLLSHNLPWKSAVLEAQFSKFVAADFAERWRGYVQRAGLCLMSAEIGSWLDAPDDDRRMTMDGLCRALKLTPVEVPIDGAQLCIEMLLLLRQRAIPPCLRGEMPHDFTKTAWHHCGMRDNGETPAVTCRVCGFSS